MGPTRFLASNMAALDTTSVTVTDAAPGIVVALRKVGGGAATLIIEGSYTGLIDRDYYVEIEGTGEMGVSTFKWSDDDGATFIGTGVLTSTSPIGPSNGLTIRFVSGTGTDFDDGDIWRFRARLHHGPPAMMDRDRDTEYRSSGTGPVLIVFDMASAVTPTVLALLDHNLSAGASLRLQASSNAFASIAKDDSLAVVPGEQFVHYIGSPAAYRYWRIHVSDPGNPDGYLRWSELFLGTYIQTTRRFETGDTVTLFRPANRERTPTGRWVGGVPVVAEQHEVEWSFLTEAERDVLFNVFDDLLDLTVLRTRPCLFHLDSDDPDSIVLAEWNREALARNLAQSPERFSVGASLTQVPRTI